MKLTWQAGAVDGPKAEEDLEESDELLGLGP